MKYQVLEQTAIGSDWDRVEWVTFYSGEPVFCPICIENTTDIINPVITSCGHIFCQLCYLQHSRLSCNKDKCPVCTTSITYHFLKPVTVVSLTDYQVGQ